MHKTFATYVTLCDLSPLFFQATGGLQRKLAIQTLHPKWFLKFEQSAAVDHSMA